MEKKTPKGTGRKVMIVIEEENGGSGFNTYLDGDIERLNDKTIPDDELGPAEYWGLKLFAIIANTLQQTGAMKRVFKKSDQ